VSRYRQSQTASGRLAARRHAQDEAWMWERIDAGLKSRFRAHAAVRELLAPLSAEVRAAASPRRWPCRLRTCSIDPPVPLIRCRE